MIVTDASAIVEILINSPKADRAVAAMRGQQIHAPALVGFEVLSAIRGKVRGGDLTPGAALTAMMRFERVEDTLELWPLLEPMTDRAVKLRENVSAYDATYVALAEILGCPLVTGDARLGRAVQGVIEVAVL